jgi:hypothetical protein
MAEHHELMGGKLDVYQRENSRHWQCSAYLCGKNFRKTIKEESLSHAKEIALELRARRAFPPEGRPSRKQPIGSSPNT